MGLYLRLQRKLQLPFGDICRLWLLAKATKIEQPVALMISPVLYDRIVAQYLQTLSIIGRRASAAPAYARIRRRLFPNAV